MNTQNTAPRRLPFGFIIAFILLAIFLGLLFGSLSKNKNTSLKIGQPAPDFSFTSYDGETVSLADFRGKVVVVNFWASWCQPCAEEALYLEKVWQKYLPGEQVVFLGVDYVDTESKARQYLQGLHISYPNGPDLKSSISRDYHVSGVPETYVIAPDGRLAFIKIGPFTSTVELTEMIDSLLIIP